MPMRRLGARPFTCAAMLSFLRSSVQSVRFFHKNYSPVTGGIKLTVQRLKATTPCDRDPSEIQTKWYARHSS